MLIYIIWYNKLKDQFEFVRRIIEKLKNLKLGQQIGCYVRGGAYNMSYIKDRVHELYWDDDINCARTMLICLSELCGVRLEKQTITSAIGLHGAGGFRAQCGLVEGGLMFIGIYYQLKGKSEGEISSLCYEYAKSFEQKFDSIRCYELRANGFTPNDPPHMCEKLTCEAVDFAYHFIMERS